METLLLNGNNSKDVALAGDILRRGGVVAIPTETVYGLAANALDEDAVGRIFSAKGRPHDNPLIVHISHARQMGMIWAAVTPAAARLADAFWPGPLTMVLPRAGGVPDIVSAGLDTVGVRMPAHPVARAVIDAAGVPLAAPSANISGRPSATCAAHAMADFAGKIDAVLDGGPCGVGVESTVVDMTGDSPVVLRPGAVTREDIAALLGTAGRAEGRHDRPRAPGMKYRHYATRAPMTLLSGAPDDTGRQLLARAEKGAAAVCFEEYLPAVQGAYGAQSTFCLGPSWDFGSHAARLFDLLRRIDETGAQAVFAQSPRRLGRNTATVNRMEKACGGNIIHCTPRRVIGITGRSGSGKSVFSRLLAARGALALDADAIYRDLLLGNGQMQRAILARFPHVCEPGGGISRRALGQTVFASAGALADLNSITHPFVARELERQMAQSPHKTVVLDVPILFGSGIDRLCTVTVGLVAARAGAVARITRRDGISAEAAEARLAAQQDDDFFRRRCDIVIENYGSLDDFQQKIDDFLSSSGILITG